LRERVPSALHEELPWGEGPEPDQLRLGRQDCASARIRVGRVGYWQVEGERELRTLLRRYEVRDRPRLIRRRLLGQPCLQTRQPQRARLALENSPERCRLAHYGV